MNFAFGVNMGWAIIVLLKLIKTWDGHDITGMLFLFTFSFTMACCFYDNGKCCK